MHLSFTLSLYISFPSSPSLSSLESTSMSLGGCFLFVEEEGEISSERLLAGHSVLPSHNHRNPGGSGEGLVALQAFCRYTSSHKLNRQNRVCLLTLNPTATRSLIQMGMYMSARGINPTCACTRVSNYCIHTHISECLFSALHSLQF